MELWTAEHAKTLIPAIAVMIVIGIVLRLTVGTKDIKTRMIPFQILACILLALEVGKQLVSLCQGYDLYHLPFHFCSLFIFAMPLMAFYNGRHKTVVSGVTSALCAALFLLMLIYPNLIYSAGNITAFFTDYMSFHTVAFHNIVMLEFVLIIALQLHTPAPKGEPKMVVLFTVCFCAVAATVAQLLKTNFANFYTCNIPVFETLRTTVQGVLGAAMTQALYILIVATLHILFVLMCYWLYRALRYLAAGKKESAQV